MQCSRKTLNNAKCLLTTASKLLSTKSVQETARSITAVRRELITQNHGNQILQRGDFIGVQPQNQKVEPISNPELIMTRLNQQMVRNFRINSETFLDGIISKIENNDEEMISMLRRSASRYIPILISMCGSVMSNVTIEKRMIILNGLWTLIQQNELAIDINSFNNRLTVFNENEHKFDAFEMLNEAEEQLKLLPNEKTFNALITRLSYDGDIEAIKRMVYEMCKRGMKIDAFVNAALIYCFAMQGNYTKADSLFDQSVKKYHDQELIPQFHSAYIKAVAVRQDLDQLAKVLRSAIVSQPDETTTKKRYTLNVPYETIFETIWILGKGCSSGRNMCHENISTQMLEHTSRRRGFFKYLYRETERHIAHGNYYCAALLIEEVKRLRDCLENQQRTIFLKQLMTRFGNQMVVNKASADEMKKIANRITTGLGHSVRFADTLLYSILTCRHMNAEAKFDYFNELINMVDESRERIHLILPLLACCESLQERLKIFFRCASIGYKDISELDIRMLSRLLLNPMFEFHSSKALSENATFDRMSKVLKSYSIAPEVTWKCIMNWWKLKRTSDSGYYIAANEVAMQNWLKSQYDTLFAPKNSSSTSYYDGDMSLQKFISFINKEDAEKVHLFLKLYGFPDELDYDQYVPRLLEIYLHNQDWTSLMSFLHMLSSSSSQNKACLKNYHVLQILRRHVADHSDINSSIEFAYDVRRLFPDAIFQKENFYHSIVAIQSLFAACLEIPKLQIETITQSMDLLRTIIKLDLFDLQREETISDQFVRVVLIRMNWNEAVNTWMKFQSSLDCSNGIVRLLKYAYRGNNLNGVQFVLHKAKTFMLESRVNAVHAATLVSLGMLDEAEEIFKAGITSVEAIAALRLINALNFRKPDSEFNVNFSRLCLQYVNFSKRSDCETLHSECMKACESQRLGTVALRIYSLFKQHNQSLAVDQMQRVKNLVDEHHALSTKWIYLPNGLINLNKTDEFKEFESGRDDFIRDFTEEQQKSYSLNVS